MPADDSIARLPGKRSVGHVTGTVAQIAGPHSLDYVLPVGETIDLWDADDGEGRPEVGRRFDLEH